jgi:PAS domain S-box-containing protein
MRTPVIMKEEITTWQIIHDWINSLLVGCFSLLSIWVAKRLAEKGKRIKIDTTYHFLDKTCDGYTLIDLEHDTEYLSEGIVKTMGYKRNDITGKMTDLVRFVYPADMVEFERMIPQLLNGNISSYEGLKRLLGKDGQWIEFKVKAVKDGKFIVTTYTKWRG